MVRLALALPFLLALARADDLYLKQGGRLFAANVRIVEEKDGKIYYLDKQLKRRSFARSMIGRVERKRSDIHEYEERYAAAKTGDAVVDIAVWAKKAKFHKDVVKRLYERALELDPENEIANTVLGRVQHEGEWMTPLEREQRIKAGEDAAMLAKGLVRWKDQWITPEDKAKLEQGLRKYKGRWMTEDEIKSAEGFVKHGGKWVRKD